jgi:hypothetical protein
MQKKLSHVWKSSKTCEISLIYFKFDKISRTSSKFFRSFGFGDNRFTTKSINGVEYFPRKIEFKEIEIFPEIDSKYITRSSLIIILNATAPKLNKSLENPTALN